MATKKSMSRIKHLLLGLKRPIREQPSDLIFFVNNICNLKCKHCFLGHSLDYEKKQDMRIDDIKKIAKSLKKPLHTLVITGGEPCLRSDLIEICEIFDEFPGSDTFFVTTNGFDTKKIVSFVESYLENISAKLVVQISLDGLPKTHNEIRNSSKSFKKALSTAGQLIKLSQNKNIFEVCFMMTLHSKNYREIKRVYEILEKYKIPLGFEAMRGVSYFKTNDDFWGGGDPRSDQLRPLSLQQLKSISKTIIDVYFENTKYITGKGLFKEGLGYAFRVEKWKYLLDIVEHKPLFKCSAGNKTGVIYSDGEIALCELTKIIGSLQDNDYNLVDVWTSKQANGMRRKIKKCFCTHGCFIYGTMNFKLQTFIRIVVNFMIFCFKRTFKTCS